MHLFGEPIGVDERGAAELKRRGDGPIDGGEMGLK